MKGDSLSRSTKQSRGKLTRDCFVESNSLWSFDSPRNDSMTKVRNDIANSVRNDGVTNVRIFVLQNYNECNNHRQNRHF